MAELSEPPAPWRLWPWAPGIIGSNFLYLTSELFVEYGLGGTTDRHGIGNGVRRMYVSN